jgi:hypothetical protein
MNEGVVAITWGRGTWLLGHQLSDLAVEVDDRFQSYLELQARAENTSELKSKIRAAYRDVELQEIARVVAVAVAALCLIMALASLAIPNKVYAFIAYVVLLASSVCATSIFKNRYLKRYAGSETLVFQEYILHRLTVLSHAQFAELSSRLEISRLLAKLSDRIAWNIEAQFRHAAKTAKIWSKSYSGAVARQYFLWSQWLITPTPLTRTDLIHFLSLDLLNVSEGRWQELSKAESGRRSQGLRSTVGKVIATILLVAGAALAWFGRSNQFVAVAIIAVAFTLAGIVGGPSFANTVSILGTVGDAMHKVRSSGETSNPRT